MPILRAGPWGNLSDAFQTVPTNTGVELTKYPVNCAKSNWLSGQTWAAWYEVEEAGCCTPATVSITNAYISSMTQQENCYYADSNPGTPPHYFDYYTQDLSYDESTGMWILTWNTLFFGFGEAHLTNNDGCDPTGTYTEIYGGAPPVVSTP